MKWLICLLAVFILWLLLFWSAGPAVLGTGAFFALIIGTCLGSIYPDRIYKVLDLRRWFYMLIYLPYFLQYCIRANLDVAVRVIHPNVPIRPGIVKVSTTLTSDMAKTFLANSITLTPGTLTVDIEGQDYYVHWINIDTDDVKKRTAEICGRFEPLLRRIFGMSVFEQVAFGVLMLSSVLCLYRIGKGPSAPDRTVAIDILGTLIVGFCCVMAIWQKREYYMNIAIAWALISFVGTLAMAKRLEGRTYDA